jgi:predicted dehydrogenase
MGGRLARAVARRSDCNLVWCVDRDLAAARRIVAEFDGPQADDDIDAVLHRSQVQAVLIATRPDSHAQLVTAAARARKHVFVEAPLATKLPDALRAHAAVGKAGVVASVDFALRAAPGVALVRSTVPGPRAVVLHATVDSLAERWEGEPEHGGVLGTFGSHALDMAAYLTGSRPLRVYGTGGRYARRSGLPDTLTATIKFAGGGVAQVVVGEIGRSEHGGTYWGAVDDGTRRAELWTDLNEARVFEDERVVAEPPASMDRERAGLRPAPTTDAAGWSGGRVGADVLLDSFVAAVRGGGRPLADSAAGVRAVQLADGLYESMRLGRAVELERVA